MRACQASSSLFSSSSLSSLVFLSASSPASVVNGLLGHNLHKLFSHDLLDFGLHNIVHGFQMRLGGRRPELEITPWPSSHLASLEIGNGLGLGHIKMGKEEN